MADASAALQALAERFWQFQRHEFPLDALLAGQPNDDPTMFREAPADFDRRAAAAVAMRAELDAIATATLAPQERISHRLLQRELDDLRDAHATLSHLKPWLLPVGPEFNTIYFANSVQLADAAGAAVYVDRLASLPGFFADVRACLALGLERGLRYPGVVLRAALANLRAAVAAPTRELPWFGPFRRMPAGAAEHATAEVEHALQVIAEGIVPAIKALAGFVETTLLPQARATVASADEPEGRAYYRFWTRHFTTCGDLEPEAVHTLGLAEVERIEAEMALVAADAGYAGDLPGYRRFLAEDAQFRAGSAEELLAQVRALAKSVDGRIPAFFGRLPRISYGVESIPAAIAPRMPPAYAQPSPADASRAGIFWISSLPEMAPAYLHVPLLLHEAWPGHLMHIALMQEIDTLPAFRRAGFNRYSACLEGWALYCETLGDDMGLYQTPHQRFGRLDMEMWRACRLAVDTGIHLQGWSRARAIEFMQQHLSLSRTTIESEVDRYIAMPAQALGYQIGGLKFRELRKRAQAHLGARFDLRAYHDTLMAAGPVTLPVLEEIVDGWLAQRAA